MAFPPRPVKTLRFCHAKVIKVKFPAQGLGNGMTRKALGTEWQDRRTYPKLSRQTKDSLPLSRRMSGLLSSSLCHSDLGSTILSPIRLECVAPVCSTLFVGTTGIMRTPRGLPGLVTSPSTAGNSRQGDMMQKSILKGTILLSLEWDGEEDREAQIMGRNLVIWELRIHTNWYDRLPYRQNVSRDDVLETETNI